jgi:hypothetical protein
MRCEESAHARLRGSYAEVTRGSARRHRSSFSHPRWELDLGLSSNRHGKRRGDASQRATDAGQPRGVSSGGLTGSVKVGRTVRSQCAASLAPRLFESAPSDALPSTEREVEGADNRSEQLCECV